ncbi:protein disulfide-isomerase 2-like isoform X2 [Clavelina lepadiformis]
MYKYKFVLVFCYGRNQESTKAEIEVAKIAKKLQDTESVVHMGKINIEKEYEIDRKYPVTRVPLLRLFKNGKTYDYTGKFNAEDALVWLDLAMNIPLQINLSSELKSLQDKVTVVLACFPGKSPKKAYETFNLVSENFVYDEYMPLPRFAMITSATVARNLGVTPGSVSVLQKFEDGLKIVYDGDTSNFDQLMKFVNEESRPVVYKHHMTEYGLKIIHETRTFQHLLFMSSDDRNYAQTWQNFKKAAKDFKKQPENQEVCFVHVDLKHHEKNKQHLNFFHIDEKKDLPCNRITKVDSYHSRFLPARKDFSYEGFVKFTKDCVQGYLKRYVRSENVPSDWDKYDVKVLVGKNYEDFVDDKKRTVFMMYYASNDKKSDETLPVFNELAREMSSDRAVVFGKMDVALNDGELDVHSNYPSFKMFTTDGKVRRYQGGVEIQAMKEFIKTGGKSQRPIDEEFEGAEFDFKWHDDLHPMPTVEEEEERRAKWEKEEKEILKNAIQHIVGAEPHNDPKHVVKEHDTHLPLEDRDVAYMDPNKHAEFDKHHEHEKDLHYEHFDEL